MSEHKQFVIRQGHDADRFLRLALLGELDLATGAELEARLAQLAPTARRIRLDLSHLDFIDCRGLRVLIDAVQSAARDRRQLVIDPDVSAPVRRLIALTDTGRQLWPGPRMFVLDERPRTEALVSRVARMLRARRRADRRDAQPTLPGVTTGP
jgi:anti-anti-sigma factor